MVLVIGLATVISTLLGGFFAVRVKDKLHLILGFSAGAVIGVAFFDLLPESIELAEKSYNIGLVTSLIALGFTLLMIFDRSFSIHPHGEDECDKESHKGDVAAAAFAIHSFIDGLGVGLAFKVSPAIGWIVATAVLAHNFSDGVNTVGVILKEKDNRQKALRWLMLDALAPALGIFSTLFFSISEAKLGLVLALFTGSFFYIGASDLIPESHHDHPTIWTTIMTVFGIITLYLVIHLAE